MQDYKSERRRREVWLGGPGACTPGLFCFDKYPERGLLTGIYMGLYFSNPVLYFSRAHYLAWNLYVRMHKKCSSGYLSKQNNLGCMPPDPLARLRAYAAQICSLVMHRSDFRSGKSHWFWLVVLLDTLKYSRQPVTMGLYDTISYKVTGHSGLVSPAWSPMW